MVRFRSVGRLAMAFAAAMSIFMTAQAADEKPYCNRDPVVTKLKPGGAKLLIDWLKQPAGKPAPLSFKVPGVGQTQIVCRINPEGIRCFESLVGPLQCPTQVEVQVPGGTTVAPVECTGPDSRGECDCDFEQN